MLSPTSHSQMAVGLVIGTLFLGACGNKGGAAYDSDTYDKAQALGNETFILTRELGRNQPPPSNPNTNLPVGGQAVKVASNDMSFGTAWDHELADADTLRRTACALPNNDVQCDNATLLLKELIASEDEYHNRPDLFGNKDYANKLRENASRDIDNIAKYEQYKKLLGTPTSKSPSSSSGSSGTAGSGSAGSIGSGSAK